MMFEIFAGLLGIGLALSSAAHAAVLLLVSILVALASLADTLAQEGGGGLWPFIRAWLALAALQLGFVVGVAGKDALRALPRGVSRWRSTTRRDRNA